MKTKKHDTASELTNGLLAEIAAAIIRELPHVGLDSVTGHGWVGKGQTLRRVLRKALVSSGDGASLVLPFKYDKTRDGWKLIERGPEPLGPFVPDIVSFLKDNESRISGYEMLGRAKFELNANLGQLDAEWLEEHQELIPKEWQGKYYLVFPGTVWQDSDDNRSVPYLSRDGDRWSLCWYWLALDWNDFDRLVRPRG